MVRDLMLWMEDVIRLIEAQENPRSDPHSRSRFFVNKNCERVCVCVRECVCGFLG